MTLKNLHLSKFSIGKGEPLTIIAGPCVIESEEHALDAAKTLKEIFSRYPIHLIFKASYDKANRSSIHSFRGPGKKKGLQILEKIKKLYDIPLLTDIHSPEEAFEAAHICDIIQIPAFLCRQTDLLVAAAQTKAAVNVKKGQFIAPHDMGNIVEKLVSSGKKEILLTERGYCFGYNNLVSDMRSIPIMKQFGFPVCFDATHSIQLPGGLGTSTGGQREFSSILAKAAIVSGANALFIEAHRNPSQAKSDASSVMSFTELEKLLSQISNLYTLVESWHA